jgi:uncharacterized protein with FMN-binding domain
MKTYNKKLIIGVVALVAVVGGVFAFVARSISKASYQTGGSSVTIVDMPAPSADSVSSSAPVTSPAANPVSAAPAPSSVPADKPPAAKSSKYKDGTYTASGTYNSPGGFDSLGVSFTINNDIVVDSNVTSGANDPRSARYQNMFISGYKPYVIGKNIDTISLDRVSGSSLTPAAFNEALGQIKTEARA